MLRVLTQLEEGIMDYKDKGKVETPCSNQEVVDFLVQLDEDFKDYKDKGKAATPCSDQGVVDFLKQMDEDLKDYKDKDKVTTGTPDGHRSSTSTGSGKARPDGAQTEGLAARGERERRGSRRRRLGDEGRHKEEERRRPPQTPLQRWSRAATSSSAGFERQDERQHFYSYALLSVAWHFARATCRPRSRDRARPLPMPRHRRPRAATGSAAGCE